MCGEMHSSCYDNKIYKIIGGSSSKLTNQKIETIWLRNQTFLKKKNIMGSKIEVFETKL